MFELWAKMDLVNFGLMQEENSKVVGFLGALMVGDANAALGMGLKERTS